MRHLLLLSINISICCLSAYAQYDNGTVIHSVSGDFNFGTIQKNYKVVDFDGDSLADILLIKDDRPNQLSWYKGDGSGNFSEQANLLEVDNNHIENEIFYEDMNGDNIEDVVFQNSDTGFTILFCNNEGNIIAEIENEVTIDNPLEADLKQVADMDGDGDMDCIFWNKTDTLYIDYYYPLGHCLIGYNDGNGTLSNYTYLDKEIPKMYLTIKTVDIDKDGDMDVISSGHYAYFIRFAYFAATSDVVLYENNGSNNFVKKPLVSPDKYGNNDGIFYSNIRTQDINNDKKEELLIEFAKTNSCGPHGEICGSVPYFQVLAYDVQNKEFNILKEYNSWLHGHIVNESEYGSPRIYDNAFQIQFGHQNTDNNLDILSINVPQGKLQWYFGDGNGNFNNTQDVNINNQYSYIRPVLRVADIDNDTDLDIFVLLNDEVSSKLTVFKNLALSAVCSPVLDLADTELTNGIYQAGVTTIAYGNVEPGNEVTLKAGKSVILQSGFQAPFDCTVNVNIGSCN